MTHSNLSSQISDPQKGLLNESVNNSEQIFWVNGFKSHWDESKSPPLQNTVVIYLISISDEFLPHGTDLRLVGWYSWIMLAISPST